MDALFSQILSSDGISKVAVLGSGCSVATEPTAEVSHYFNVTQVGLLQLVSYRLTFNILFTLDIMFDSV